MYLVHRTIVVNIVVVIVIHVGHESRIATTRTIVIMCGFLGKRGLH